MSTTARALVAKTSIMACIVLLSTTVTAFLALYPTRVTHATADTFQSPQLFRRIDLFTSFLGQWHLT